MRPAALLTVCLNPVLQRTLVFDSLREGEVNRARSSRVDASGKGVNVARVLTQLDARVTHLTQAGGRQRELFLELLRTDGIAVEWVESGSEIRWCTTVLSRGAATTTELVEEATPVSEETEPAIRQAFDRLLPEHSSVIFSGTKAAGFSSGLFPDLIQRARARGARVVLDVRGPDLLDALPYGPDVAKPNIHEFVATFLPDPGAAPADRDVQRRVREKVEELSAIHATAFVLTRGSEPALVAEKGSCWEQAGERVTPLNATGSGDAFTAGLALALEQGASLRDAVDKGHWAGARNAERLRPGVIE